jgi:hypothetical protein
VDIALLDLLVALVGLFVEVGAFGQLFGQREGLAVEIVVVAIARPIVRFSARAAPWLKWA